LKPFEKFEFFKWLCPSVLAGDISHPPAQIGPFVLAGVGGVSENPDEIPEHEQEYRVHVQVE
jgi:hypothetical protein